MKLLIITFALILTAAALDEAIPEFRVGNNLLSSDIYELLSKKSDNFLLSPFSLETILALTLSGAKGETAAELQKGLRLPKNGTEEVFTSFLAKLRGGNYTLASANKIYVQENFKIYDEFRKTAVEKYGAGLENIDFQKKTEAATAINAWVEEHTNKKINNIIAPSAFTDDTSLVLINALYFKGNWSNPFLASDTTVDKFYLKENEEVTVATLHTTNGYNYYECSELDAKFLELTYEGGDVSLVIVLPNAKNGITNLETKIAKVFTPKDFTLQPVKVALPKFKVGSTIDMLEILKELGVRAAFDNSKVDFSGIAGKTGELKISSILQKTFIEVNEEGAEAAASTLIHMESVATSAITVIHVEPKTFIVDHPFVFYIKVNDVVLFGGKVMNPTL